MEFVELQTYVLLAILVMLFFIAYVLVRPRTWTVKPLPSDTEAQ
jgi:hypothetical protein